MKAQSCGLFSCSAPKVQRSAIEDWIIRRGRRYTPKWQFLSGYGESVFGHPLYRGCSPAPEIYLLRAGDLNTRFVETASDSEIGEFVRTMQKGTRPEKAQAVKTACGKALGLGKRARPHVQGALDVSRPVGWLHLQCIAVCCTMTRGGNNHGRHTPAPIATQDSRRTFSDSPARHPR
jgi:hypothetical protein